MTSTPGSPTINDRSHSTLAYGRSRVLLADDDGELRDALAFLLRQRGYTVDTVSSGIGLVNALSAALLDGEAAPADAIVTDVRMPGCNGLNVVEGLRANGWDLPVVVITAFGDDDMRARLTALDGVFLLEKPFTADELHHLLQHLLRTA